MQPSSEDDDSDYFSWLLSRVMPWAGGHAVMLEAHFDASARDGGIFSVGGFAFGEDRAKKALHDWKGLWGSNVCHMKHLNFNPEKFYGFDKTVAGHMLVESVKIINHYASYGVAVSCSVGEVARLAPKSADPGSRYILGGLSSAYAMCTHAAMAALGRMVGESDVAYFFEAGDENQGESQEFIKGIDVFPLISQKLYKMRTSTVMKKADNRLFEAADIIAWEWAKDVERLTTGMPRRPSLTAILGDELVEGKDRANVISPTRRGWHLTGEPMERYYRRFEEYELLSDNPSPEAAAKLMAAARHVVGD